MEQSEKTPLRIRCTHCRAPFLVPQKSGYCGPCSKERSRQWRADHPKPKRVVVLLDPNRARRTHCSACGLVFPEPRRSAYCSPCGVQRTKEWGEKNPEKLAELRKRFAKRTKCSKCGKEMPPRPGTRCAPCDRVYHKGRRAEARAGRTAASARYRAKHREKYMKTLMAWRKANPGLVSAAKQRNYSKRKGAPGGHTHEEWLQALVVAKFRCVYCGISLTEKTATRDHATPLTRNGSNDISNIVPACRKCNSTKYNRTPEEFVEANGKAHSTPVETKSQ